MATYARDLPVDKQGNPYTEATPAYPANQSWSSVFTVSSTIGLNDKTTVVQLSAFGAPANFKWGPNSVTGTSFDGTIPINTQVTFVVPQSIMAVGYSASMMGANGANGLYNSISIKTLGGNTGSVFGAEF